MSIGPTGYTHDVFVSYSRAESWPRFVTKHFVPVFKHWLTAELGRGGRIYLDTTSVGVGQRWPEELEVGLSTSVVMVSLWSRNYFGSQWCRRELSSMVARMDALRKRDINVPVIFPVVLHDCISDDDIPELVSDLQYLEIREYADPFMHPGGRKREGLSSAVRPLCAAVATTITHLPGDAFIWPPPDFGEPLEVLTEWSASRRHSGKPTFAAYAS